MFTPPNESWLSRLGDGYKRQVWFKTFTIPAFMTVFFTGYFLLLNNPVFPMTTMPTLFVDDWIPFEPGALGFYVSLWIYVQFPPLLIGERRELVAFGVASAALGLVGFTCFFFWPTAIPLLVSLDEAPPLFANLLKVDASGNSCPSLHAAFAVFSALWIHRRLRRAAAPRLMLALNLCWCAGIVYSTLATKQHVAVDIIVGSALGALAALLYAKYEPRRATALTA